MKLEGFGSRQLQLHPHHIVGKFLQCLHTHRHFFDREGTSFDHLLGFQHHVRQGRGAAGQHEALGQFVSTQGFGLVVGHRDLASHFFAFARTASAIFAAVGQANALADTGGQNGFICRRGKMATAGLNDNLKRHLRNPCS